MARPSVTTCPNHLMTDVFREELPAAPALATALASPPVAATGTSIAWSVTICTACSIVRPHPRAHHGLMRRVTRSGQRFEHV